MRRVRESTIQKTVVDYARKAGMITIKQGMAAHYGTAGWPDYLFINRHGIPFFIEFKAPGRRPTPRQVVRIELLRMHRIVVYVIDSVEEGKQAILDMLHAETPPQFHGETP